MTFSDGAISWACLMMYRKIMHKPDLIRFISGWWRDGRETFLTISGRFFQFMKVTSIPSKT